MHLLYHFTCFFVFPHNPTQFVFAQLIHLTPPLLLFRLLQITPSVHFQYISLFTVQFPFIPLGPPSLLVFRLASSNLLYHTNLNPVLPSLCLSVHSCDNFSKLGALLAVCSSTFSLWVHYFNVLCRHDSTRLRYLSSSETCAGVKAPGENTTRQTNGSTQHVVGDPRYSEGSSPFSSTVHPVSISFICVSPFIQPVISSASRKVLYHYNLFTQLFNSACVCSLRDFCHQAVFTNEAMLFSQGCYVSGCISCAFI